MKHVSRLLLFSLLIALAACGQPQANPVPEWKAAYLQLMKDTLTDGILEPRGIMKGHTIELINYDGDGIPELQETFIRNAPDYHVIWLIENGEARPITGDHALWEKTNDTIKFEGLWRHNETGELILTDFLDSWGHSRLYRYSPTAGKGIKEMHHGRFSGLTGIKPPASFSCTGRTPPSPATTPVPFSLSRHSSRANGSSIWDCLRLTLPMK